jgi:Arc/MetJ-type ribon-helix-helix transcriptional regulator
MQQKDRIATLTATVQAEKDAKKERVPKYDRFARADAALAVLTHEESMSEDSITARATELNGNAVSLEKDTDTDLSAEPIESQRVIRETFSLPPVDRNIIQTLRDRCLEAGVYVSKSELIRAGLHVLEGLAIQELRSAIATVERLPVGKAAKSYNGMKSKYGKYVKNV